MDNGLVQIVVVYANVNGTQVLILIVVDNGLVQNGSRTVVMNTIGLNPYCSGQWSRTVGRNGDVRHTAMCLNPYCSGQWSRTDGTSESKCVKLTVLILIVVDNGLVLINEANSDIADDVLILIVVDNGLVQDYRGFKIELPEMS